MKSERHGPSGIVFINKHKQLPEPNWATVNSTFFTTADVATHNTKEDGWIIFNKKYHPGGIACIEEYLGKDITAITKQIHSWVAIEHSIQKLQVGLLKPDAKPDNIFK